MLTELIVGGFFASIIIPAIFPRQITLVKEAARLAYQQKTMNAKTSEGKDIKGYPAQELARRHRVELRIGETIYFPNGMRITAEEGLKDVQVDGWWYAWSAISAGGKSLPALKTKD